mmetsp:Transcript_1688/g.4870  ORF Transcript_1688/g.4870 Transcript_1688/m.4870 type:complete len:238 (+) Transcript_1688:535-1248(+)
MSSTAATCSSLPTSRQERDTSNTASMSACSLSSRGRPSPEAAAARMRHTARPAAVQQLARTSHSSSSKFICFQDSGGYWRARAATPSIRGGRAATSSAAPFAAEQRAMMACELVLRKALFPSLTPWKAIGRSTVLLHRPGGTAPRSPHDLMPVRTARMHCGSRLVALASHKVTISSENLSISISSLRRSGRTEIARLQHSSGSRASSSSRGPTHSSAIAAARPRWPASSPPRNIATS